MSKMNSLQQALKENAGKPTQKPVPAAASPTAKETVRPASEAKPSARAGKVYTGAWLHADFGTSLRMVQLRRGRDAQGRKVYLDDLIAEALNDLYVKYDVPTVLHE